MPDLIGFHIVSIFYIVSIEIQICKPCRLMEDGSHTEITSGPSDPDLYYAIRLGDMQRDGQNAVSMRHGFDFLEDQILDFAFPSDVARHSAARIAMCATGHPPLITISGRDDFRSMSRSRAGAHDLVFARTDACGLAR